ncbi:putative tRNA-dihydrouridine synthase [Waddlia chondrophila 2032/99]|uniref:tRNA-dihydrouridine synthase n=2 Tax=Waddlia chondrophila TaxID=71667 RepID=D6YTB0_WADCW|nr:tRNA dihydrouridine synthase DusB [Waddlia chondrophila]ADI39305.1 putative tRNA-dihydrouridine synthase B [Waddlia chondrophila WSU 86-1044]CCB90546.1 putative tRNA-dihydrouridine synthase [Waddlia chondrophila 2032/99]
MKFIQTPFKLGNISLPNNVFYSPLAGCSDFPFRQMCAQYNPGLIYCEMVKMDALIRHDPATFHILDYEEGMHPIGAQLCGSKPELAGKAAKILEDLGFDVIDLNCGCPVDKVTKDGSGSGLLKQPEKIAEILSEMVAAVSVPVTVKIRAGWDDESIIAEEITRLAEKAGAAAIAIHGRTRKQAYRGDANWDYIKACKETAGKIKVIGNGDVFDAEAAEQMFRYTGCDAVLVSRGTMGKPWIAEDIQRHLCGLKPVERTLEDDRKALLEHYRFASRYHSDRRTVLEMRKVGCWYLKKSPGTRDFRGLISKAKNLEEVRELIENYGCC